MELQVQSDVIYSDNVLIILARRAASLFTQSLEFSLCKHLRSLCLTIYCVHRECHTSLVIHRVSIYTFTFKEVHAKRKEKEMIINSVYFSSIMNCRFCALAAIISPDR